MEDSFKRYKNKIGEYPKFKNKGRPSYRTNNVTRTYYGHNYNSISIDIEKRIIKLPKLKDLRIREWECPKCTDINNRDINASINIMFEGLKLYMKKGVELQSI